MIQKLGHIQNFLLNNKDDILSLQKHLFLALQITNNILSFPGSQPVSFQRENLNDLINRDYYVCEKSDGMRYFLYLTSYKNGDLCAVLIDRSYKIFLIPDFYIPSRRDNNSVISALLDGEMVEHGEKLTFYIFDILLFDEKNVCSLNLPERLKIIQNDVVSQFKKWYKDSMRDCPFDIQMKEMYKPYGIGVVLKKIQQQAHPNDGLIFTPVDEPYTSGTTNTL